jgi:hypothetical protein
MTLFAAQALDTAPTGARPALRVSTKYMENFLPLRPVSSGTEVHTFLNSAGALDLYSVGSDGNVRRYRRSADAIAPYDETDLMVQASQLYLFTPANADPDNPAIFGLDAKGGLTLATYENGAYGQVSTGPRNDVIRRFLGVRGTTGRIYINARLDDGSLVSNYYDPLNKQWGGPVWAPVKGPDGNDAKVADIAVAANNPYQSALFAIGTDGEVLFAEDSFRSSQLRKLYKKASHIAAIVDADDLLNIFAVEMATGLLWVKRQRKHSPKGIQFDDWVQVDPGQSGRLGRLRVNLRRDGLLEVFALDETGDLRYTRQTLDNRGKAGDWQVLFPIDADMENAIFTVGRNANGYSEAFTVSTDNELTRFWQSPETGQWFSEVLDLPQRDEQLISVPTHSTELFVVDAAGAPLAGAKVTVNAAFLSTLWVDGKAHRSSIVDAVSLETDATGKIVILQRANALAGATLLVSTPATPAGQPIKVQPNAELQSRLSRLSKQDVLDAKDTSGNLLLAAGTKDRDKVAESIAEVTKRSMEIAQGDESAGLIQYKFAAPLATGFRLESDFHGLGEVAWEIDFTSGVPIYSPSDQATVAAFRAEHTDQIGALGGFPGIDWGAVWNGIKKGVVWLVDGIEKIIVTVVDGIATVLFKIAGKIFEAVLKFAQQAFDFIEGVWNWLEVKLQQLYEWLAFLFDFKDFARTAEGIKHAVGVTLDFSADAIHLLRDKVEQGFEQLKGGLDDTVNKLIAQLDGDGDPTLGGYFGQQEASSEAQHAQDHNIFYNAFDQNAGRIQVKDSAAAALALAADSSLDPFIEKLKSLTDNFQFGDGKQAFDEAFGYFDNIGQQPGNAVNLLLSGLIKALEGVALFALDFAEGVVLTIFDVLEEIIRAFRALIFEAWEVPVLSQLYQLFTGHSLTITPVDIIAWVAAIPMTITSKLVLGRTPWTDSQLARFKETFTVAMLKARVGIASDDGQRLLAAVTLDDQQAWRENFLTGYCCVMAVRSLLDPSTVAASATGTGLGKAGIVGVGARFLTTCFTMPWALSADAKGPNCKPGDPGFGVTIWICQLIFGPIRGGVIVYLPGLDAKPKIYLGELSLTLWGVVNIIMASVNFGYQPQTTRNKLAYSRTMLNIVPGQFLRFLAVPELNEAAEFIPAAILGVLSFLSCWGSLGVAIAEIHTDE